MPKVEVSSLESPISWETFNEIVLFGFDLFYSKCIRLSLFQGPKHKQSILLRVHSLNTCEVRFSQCGFHTHSHKHVEGLNTIGIRLPIGIDCLLAWYVCVSHFPCAIHRTYMDNGTYLRKCEKVVQHDDKAVDQGKGRLLIFQQNNFCTVELCSFLFLSLRFSLFW